MKKPAKEELLADLLSSATWAEIAAKYGYSDPRFLRRLARQYGLPKRRVILKPSRETLERLILAEGLTPREVAQKLGYGPNGWSNIYAYCRQYGIEFDHSPHRALRERPFTERQQAIVFGSLLGDASLRPSGRSGRSYARSFTHGEKQKAYLEWKLREFEDFVLTKKFYRACHDFHGNAPTYSFSTISHPFLRYAHQVCFPEGSSKKDINPVWLSHLTALSLAVWYLDDGSLNRRYRTIVLCTNAFSREGQLLAAAHFADRWNIGCKLEPRRNGQTVLRINASQANRFLALVAPFVPACMAYKLG